MKPYGAKKNYNELDDFNRKLSRDGGVKNSKAVKTKKRCNKTLKTRGRRENKSQRKDIIIESNEQVFIDFIAHSIHGTLSNEGIIKSGGEIYMICKSERDVIELVKRYFEIYNENLEYELRENGLYYFWKKKE